MEVRAEWNTGKPQVLCKYIGYFGMYAFWYFGTLLLFGTLEGTFWFLFIAFFDAFVPYKRLSKVKPKCIQKVPFKFISGDMCRDWTWSNCKANVVNIVTEYQIFALLETPQR